MVVHYDKLKPCVVREDKACNVVPLNKPSLESFLPEQFSQAVTGDEMMNNLEGGGGKR